MRSGRQKTYLALDLGAESGRAMVGRLQSDVLTIEEVHRFPNGPIEYGGSLHWDTPRLWMEIKRGIDAVTERALDGIGVDTWGVDFALLGERGELLANPHHYRDQRTAGIMAEVFEAVPAQDIYEATGIQFMPINTLYQLMAMRRDQPRLLAAADRMVTMPDLFHYWMTGNAVCEFTNATTTQLVDPRTRNWATGLMERLGLPKSLPGPIVEPGTVIGALQTGVAGQTMLAGTPVIAPAAHDTGSAVASVSARDGTAFLSSGTWSLVGMEVDSPVINPAARALNFTNEGGVCGTTRLLKNVMGLWILQCCRRKWVLDGHTYEYGELIRLASREPAFQNLIDPDDGSFLNPQDMPGAIEAFCRKTDQRPPATPGGYARTVLESLALKYRMVIRRLETLTGIAIENIRVVGGGCRNELLNQFTADATGKRVIAGPVEATALGNIAIQMLATGAAGSIEASRRIIDRSFAADTFEPYNTAKWDSQAERFEQYCEVTYA